jgi:RimJ/RimL family protein N-acetyltransferase
MFCLKDTNGGLIVEYYKRALLKDGRVYVLRNGTEDDAPAVLDNFILTHGQTDFLLTYPEEMSFTPEREREYLRKKTESGREVEIVAEIEGNIVGTAGIDALGNAEKTRHRASFGISVDKAYWGYGIGRALACACIECAKAAGYTQLELEVVAENKRAAALYGSLGFVEFGRNPRGFLSRASGMQEVILMRLELD